MVDLHQVRSKSKGEIWQSGGVGYIPAIAVIIPTIMVYNMDMIATTLPVNLYPTKIFPGTPDP